MGNTDSKLVFKQGILRLASSEKIWEDDIFWKSFYTLPTSAQDVFSLFRPLDIRRARDSSPGNLTTLVKVLIHRLSWLRKHRSFSHANLTLQQEALNCIRVLTRILPFIYEDNRSDGYLADLLWNASAVSARQQDCGVSHTVEQPSHHAGSSEHVRLLGEQLVDVLIDLLFCQNFTISPEAYDEEYNGVSYAIWHDGVGRSRPPPKANRDMENNRLEILRLILTLNGQRLYLQSHIVPVKDVKSLSYMISFEDKQIVLALLCSLLNTTLKGAGDSWSYEQLLLRGAHEGLVIYSVQLLLALLTYHAPHGSASTGVKNQFRRFVGRIHRAKDFEYIADGILASLGRQIQAQASYLPSPRKNDDIILNLVMLFWEMLQSNQRFLNFVVDSKYGPAMLRSLLSFAITLPPDGTRLGMSRICLFALQTLSTGHNFGYLLNQPLRATEDLPLSNLFAENPDTHGDLLVMAIFKLITSSQDTLDAILPTMLATLNNAAPYLEHLNSAASSNLLMLFGKLSAPGFILSGPRNHQFLRSIIKTINAIVEHQYMDNQVFIRHLFEHHHSIEELRTLAVMYGQAFTRETRLQENGGEVLLPPTPGNVTQTISDKDRQTPVDTGQIASSPGYTEPVTSKNGEINQAAHTGHGSSETHSSQNRKTSNALPSSSHESPSTLGQSYFAPSDMSEKAKGKLPADISFTRSNVVLSPFGNISSYSSPAESKRGSIDALTAPRSLVPTQKWMDAWSERLPLTTMMKLLEYAKPPATLPPEIEKTTPHLHAFEWTSLALGWYESLLWGSIFTSEMLVNKGALGIWNGTAIKLFRVKAEVARSPTLREPLGAVDAVGQRIVEGVSNLSLKQIVGAGPEPDSPRGMAGPL